MTPHPPLAVLITAAYFTFEYHSLVTDGYHRSDLILDDSIGTNGIEQATIDRLPVHSITAEDVLSPDGDHLCSICLAPYEEGDDVRIVMCMHKFHKRCIDPWLRTHPTCPVCKNRAVE